MALVPDAEKRLRNIMVFAEATAEATGLAARRDPSTSNKLMAFSAAENLIYAQEIWKALTGSEWPGASPAAG